MPFASAAPFDDPEIIQPRHQRRRPTTDDNYYNRIMDPNDPIHYPPKPPAPSSVPVWFMTELKHSKWVMPPLPTDWFEPLQSLASLTELPQALQLLPLSLAKKAKLLLKLARYDVSVIQTLFQSEYAKHIVEEVTGETLLPPDLATCLVCQEHFSEDDVVVTLQWEHLFHRKCVGEWLYIHDNDSCPHCRAKVEVRRKANG